VFTNHLQIVYTLFTLLNANGLIEIYPSNGASESTASTRLGFPVPSLTNALGRLREIHATGLTEPSDTPFGRRAVVKDFEGHRVEIYEKAP
jgi:lactoylglutathione lyase